MASTTRALTLRDRVAVCGRTEFELVLMLEAQGFTFKQAPRLTRERQALVYKFDDDKHWYACGSAANPIIWPYLYCLVHARAQQDSLVSLMPDFVI